LVRTKWLVKMGRVRTKTVKRAARAIVEKYYSKMTQDFQSNKRLCDEIAVIQTKRLRNKIAGYATHLMKRIQKGPVRGISLRLQEEERERKLDYVPEVSCVSINNIRVDPQTSEMLKALDLVDLPNIKVEEISK
jgi:small subunit ribosomal protein S17e